MYATYKVYYRKTGQTFDRSFRESDAVSEMGNDLFLTELQALRFVNKWNQQNGESGFTYWIE